jgi:hypothetical protein
LNILSTCSGQTLGIRKMGDAKVTNFDLATVFCPQKVRGFDISMDNTLMMYWEKNTGYKSGRGAGNNDKLRTIFEPQDCIS